ncbi:MAG: response regulator [Ignavibacteriae bacterium]|nr:response regulator [Ignavibacteriota bacterium]
MKQNILAVDDEPDLLRLLERIIKEKTPYQITVTNNSLEVPMMLEQNEYDIIITDLKMPGMDGLDILKYVKDHKRFEQVIIITAFGSLETAMEALSQGVYDYITKPFKKEQIIFTVDRAMKYQNNVLESLKFSELFNMPLDEAVEAFKIEYNKRKSD